MCTSRLDYVGSGYYWRPDWSVIQSVTANQSGTVAHDFTHRW